MYRWINHNQKLQIYLHGEIVFEHHLLKGNYNCRYALCESVGIPAEVLKQQATDYFWHWDYPALLSDIPLYGVFDHKIYGRIVLTITIPKGRLEWCEAKLNEGIIENTR